MEPERQEVVEAPVKGVIRPYLTMDLLWLEDIARKHNEWEALLHSLTVGVAAFVIEPDAIAVIFYDEHGLRIGALTDKSGIKSMIRICRMMVAGANATDTKLHGHWPEESWQAKIARQNGFVLNGHGYYETMIGG